MKAVLAAGAFLLGSLSLASPIPTWAQAKAPGTSPESETRRLIAPFAAVTPTGIIEIQGEESRKWTDPFGGSVNAEMIGLSGALIGLEVEGEPMAYPLAGVSPVDREYVRRVLESRGQSRLYPGTTDPQDEAATMRLTPREWEEKLSSWTATAMKTRTAEGLSSVREHIRNVCDPAALSALTTLIRRNLPDAIRTAMVEAIGHVGGDEATKALVGLAATDSSGAVRASAAWALCDSGSNQVAMEVFAKELRKRETREIALMSLAMTGIADRSDSDSEMEDALWESLIDMLVVKQPVTVPYYVWQSWGYAYASPGGGHSHFHFHSRRIWKTFFVPVPCELAHRILVKKSGHDYGYDRNAWRQWYHER